MHAYTNVVTTITHTHTHIYTHTHVVLPHMQPYAQSFKHAHTHKHSSAVLPPPHHINNKTKQFINTHYNPLLEWTHSLSKLQQETGCKTAIAITSTQPAKELNPVITTTPGRPIIWLTGSAQLVQPVDIGDIDGCQVTGSCVSLSESVPDAGTRHLELMI